MGQERFADVVERFTNGFGVSGATASPETVKQWQEELDRNLRRLTNFARLGTAAEPRTGQTPRQEVYKRNKSRLYRYESSRRHRTPLLFVPNLGISRPYIFDLLPGGSQSPRDVRSLRAVGARLLHGRAVVGVVRGLPSRDPREELHQHGGPD